MRVEKRVALSQRALFRLKLALATLVEEGFGGRLTQDAERWGYRMTWLESEATVPAPQ